ncbi:hypothetical protein, partial [Barnesiella intestinihominis]|uniref:hypothetical protein n=1 Tax=Barnesiella intestinihominis TaxID=487174 RepID=UPI003AF95E7A
PPRRWYCASGRVGSRQLIGERAGEGEPLRLSLFLYIGLTTTPAPIQKLEKFNLTGIVSPHR